MIDRMREIVPPRLDLAEGQNEQEDLDPRNLSQIDKAIRHPDQQGEHQQSVLMGERQRLEQVQAERMRQGAAMFQQRLQQRLNPRIGTQDDTDPQALDQFQRQLMMQMMRRHGFIPPRGM